MNREIILFGLPSWALIDITWSMVSQISQHVPESYSITVYLIFALTIGNLVPLLLNHYFSKISTNLLSTMITSILSIGFICGVALSLLWNKPITIGSHQYSIPFCCVFFLIGACSSSSNVTHYMFISQFPSQSDTTSLSTGMALGSMTAGLLGMIQGLLLSSWGFSVSYAFLAIAALFLPSLYSFRKLSLTASPRLPVHESEHTLLSSEKEDHSYITSSFSSFYQHHPTLVRLQFFNTCLGYGIIPALISPICSSFRSPYLVILLATGIFCVLDPLCRSMTVFWSLSSISFLSFASYLLYSIAILLLIPLLLPSSSALLSSPVGGLYPILLYVSFGTLFGFINTSVFLFLKQQQSTTLSPSDSSSTSSISSRGASIQHAYRYTGIISQTGALCGSLVSFLLVISGVIR
jgi:MFS family permease